MKINEILLLWKIQLLGFFGVNQAKNSKSGVQKKKARGFFVTAGISVFAFIYLSTQYSIMLASTLSSFGMVHLMPELMYTVCCLLVMFTTVIKAAPTLFGAGDTDMLMSLPVKTSSIIASRVLVLFTMDFIYTASFLIPMGIVYTRYADPGVAGMIMFAVMFIFAAFVPGVISCILAVLVAWISSFFKRTSFFKNIFSMLFFVGIFMFSFASGSSNDEKIANISTSLAGKIGKVYPLTGLFGRAMCNGDVAAFVIFIAVSAASFALFCTILGIFFKKLLSVVNAKHTGNKYKLGELRTSSQFKALYKKELKRFFSCNIYFMNCGIGSIMSLVVTVGLVFAKNKLFAQLAAEGAGILPVIMRILPFLLTWCICMCSPSSCSVSLEGKNFWLVRALPISAKNVLMAKAAMSITISAIPALVSSVVLCIAFDLSAMERIMLLVLPLLYSVFSSLLGLRVNLKYPMLDWKNENMPVKQSTASFISTIGFMPLSIVPAFLIGLSGAFYVPVALAICAVFVVCSILLYRNLTTKSEKLLSAVE